MADNEPMTDKRRYEIIAIHAMPNKDDSDEVLDALRDLLIENDRLRAEVAVQAEAMRIAADRDGLMHLLQEGRKIVAQLSAENAAMRPIVKEVATRRLGGIPRIQFYEQARAFLAPARQTEKTPLAGGFFDTDGKWHSLFPGEE